MFHQSRIRNPLTSIALVALGFAAATVVACGGATTIEQSWTSPTAQNQPPIQKAVTLFISNDETTRRAGEDQLARDLAAKGVQAVPAYSILGGGDVRDLNAVKSKLTAQGFDGVVTMRIVDQEQQLEYVPPTFDGYWDAASPDFYDSGYTYPETVVRVETTAYSLRSNQLVWSALTKTVDPSTTNDLVDETSNVVASQLTERGLAG